MCKKSFARMQKVAFMPCSMSRHYLVAVFVTLCLLLGSRLSPAVEIQDVEGNPIPESVESSTTSEPAPSSSSSITPPADASETKKPFIITATLREGYDDNIFTSKDNKVSSLTTDVEPSILFDFPMDQSDLSIRFSGGLTYFYNRAGGSPDKTA